jgi:hypothetical protein
MPPEPQALSSCLLVYACIPVALSDSEPHGHLVRAWSSEQALNEEYEENLRLIGIIRIGTILITT